MNKVIKINFKKIILYIAIFFIGWGICFFKFTQSVYKPQSACKSAIIKTYLKNIRTASDNFYEEYYKISPIADYFSITVKRICEDKSLSIITFISEPFIGAHNTVGTDEISFTVNLSGDIQLKEFIHKKSYFLPEHLKSLIKQPIPGDYE